MALGALLFDMPPPLQFGDFGGAESLFVLLLYLLASVLYLLLPLVVVFILRDERGRLDELVRDRLGGLVERGLGERLRAGRSGAFNPRDR